MERCVLAGIYISPPAIIIRWKVTLLAPVTFSLSFTIRLSHTAMLCIDHPDSIYPNFNIQKVCTAQLTLPGFCIIF
jgi:hypothetical protein